MEALCDLLFELSNEDRLGILTRLHEDATNVTGLAKQLDLTLQECSRHVSRLIDARIVSRSQDGLCHVTPFGELLLTQLGGIRFMSSHRNYLMNHSLEGIPARLRSGLGEMYESQLLDDPTVSMYNIERLVSEAEDYVWTINFPIPRSVFPLLRMALERGVKVRMIAPRKYEMHPVLRGTSRKEDREAYRTALAKGQLLQRYIDRMSTTLWLSEKECVVAFPTSEGRFDLLGFSSKQKAALDWCRDLFESDWNHSEP